MEKKQNGVHLWVETGSDPRELFEVIKNILHLDAGDMGASVRQ